MRYFWFCILCLAAVSTSFAEVTNDASDKALVFEIIQNEYNLNIADVKAASVIQDNGVYKGLHIELKPAAAAEFETMASNAVRKKINFVFNKRIVSSTILQLKLKGNFVLSGISQPDALAFVRMLSDEAKTARS